MSSQSPVEGASFNKSETPVYSPQTHPEVFPVLTAEELEQCQQFGSVCHFAKGEKIIAARQPVNACYVVLSGEVRIMDTTAGKRTCIAQYGTGVFTGDIDLFTGRPAIVDLEAATDLKAICIPKMKIREIMVRNPLLGDKFWGSFQTRREAILRTVFQGLHVYGTRNDRRTLEVIEFLYRNGVPMSWKNTDEKEHADACIRIAKNSTPRFPVISYGEGLLMESPTLLELADKIGIDHDFSQSTYDVIILGAGPAGLGAAVYAASEGLSTLVLDGIGPGGQAGSSSKIENYAGFPNGVSGRELAQLSYLQALKFGAFFASPCHVAKVIRNDDDCYELTTTEGKRACGRTILIATGVDYRLLDVKGLQQLSGTGVYYSATTIEATLCANSKVHVIGGGNSAGQAAMFLSQHAREVTIILRSDALEKSMSSYLSERVKANPKIKILFKTQVVEIEGGEHITAVHLRSEHSRSEPLKDDQVVSDESIREETSGLFIFIGNKPKTDFLPVELMRDEGGYVITGAGLLKSGHWHEDRSPQILETSMPGIFAGGDCRAGTTKRVAAAIGDGALAVTCITNFLARTAAPQRKNKS